MSKLEQLEMKNARLRQRADQQNNITWSVGQIVILRANGSKWKIIMLDDHTNFLVESCKSGYEMWAKPSHFII